MNLQEFPFIDMGKIGTHDEVMSLAKKVYELIPCGDTSDEYILDLKKMYRSCKSFEFSGWCVTNALMLHHLLSELWVPSYVLDYGDRDHKFSHSVVIATIQGIEYLIDPYFCRYPCVGDFIVPFKEVVKSASKDPDCISWSYLPAHKPALREGSWVYMIGESFFEDVLTGWVNVGFEGHPNDLLAMSHCCTSIRKKTNGKLYYEFW